MRLDEIDVDGEEAGLSAADTPESDFSQFVASNERSLRQAFTGWLGPDLGRDATAEALAYAWEHWDRVSGMDNPSGYLYRVGLNWGRRKARRRETLFPVDAGSPSDLFEPGLADAIAGLSDRQRAAVYLVHGHGWSLGEVADLLGVSKGTVQTHLERGLTRLRRRLGVHDEN